jgi:hypothetical protein
VFTLHRRIASLRHLVINTIADEQPFAFRVAGSGRRQLSWCTVTRHPTAKWLARQVTKAFSWDKAPTGIVRDNNIALDSNFIRRILALSIRSWSNSFRSPWQNGRDESLVRPVRRERADQPITFNKKHLRRILTEVSTHHVPNRRSIERLGNTPRSVVMIRLSKAWRRSPMYRARRGAATPRGRCWRLSRAIPTATSLSAPANSRY